MYKNNSLTPTQISNYWDDLWSDEDEEEEAPDLLNSLDTSDDEEEKDAAVMEGPPGIINFSWEQTRISEMQLGEEMISKFDMLFARQLVTEEFEVIEDGDPVTEYPSVNGGIFDWSQLDEGDEILWSVRGQRGGLQS